MGVVNVLVHVLSMLLPKSWKLIFFLLEVESEKIGKVSFCWRIDHVESY